MTGNILLLHFGVILRYCYLHFLKREKLVLIICIVLPLWFIGVEGVLGQNSDSIKEYRIERIKKRNNWYFIYASRNDSLFKIASKETTDKGKYARHDKIRRHKKYDLILESYSDNAPVVNGVKVVIPGYTGGFCLDSCTTVMLEPRKGIWNLYTSPNLKGIYYLPPNKEF